MQPTSDAAPSPWEWRYQEEPPSMPQLSEEDESLESKVDWSWFRLQILHTPFRAAERGEYLAFTAWLKDLEHFFLEHPELEDYYKECFDDETKSQPQAGTASSIRSPGLDHVAAGQIRFMEQVLYGLKLDRYANAPDNRGWMNLFRRWGRSSTLNERLDELRSTLTLNFLEFYDFYLRYYPYRIDEHPIPHPWDHPRERQDPRAPEALPPARTGGEASPRPAPPPRDKLKGPILPGLYLDSGVREAGRGTGEWPVEQPGTPRQGVPEENEAALQGGDSAPAAPPGDGPGPVAPNE